MIEQKITSVKTSRKQIPAAINKDDGEVAGKRVLNFGCGLISMN